MNLVLVISFHASHVTESGIGPGRKMIVARTAATIQVVGIIREAALGRAVKEATEGGPGTEGVREWSYTCAVSEPLIEFHTHLSSI